MKIKVLRQKKKSAGTCLHRYNPETDMPLCKARIKRENWEVIEMDYDVWRGEEWMCWNCPAL